MNVPECFAFSLENLHPENDVPFPQRHHAEEIKVSCMVKQWLLAIAACRTRAV